MPTETGQSDKENSDAIENLFELLKERGLIPNQLARLKSWKSKEIIDLASDLDALIPYTQKHADSPFEFVANSTLSGGNYPCDSLPCRINHVDGLARFAALYSDRVLIRNPLEKYTSVAIPKEQINQEFFIDLSILFRLRPLLKSGLIGFSFSKYHFCPDCYRKLQAKQFDQRIMTVRAQLQQRMWESARFTLEKVRRGPAVVIKGSETYFGHPRVIYRFARTPKPLAKVFDPHTPQVLTEDQVREIKLLEYYSNWILDDLTWQNYYANSHRLQYVTDRDLDFEVIRDLNDEATNKTSIALANALSHHVPIVHGPELSTLLALRQKEGESFRVYRDALALALKSGDSGDPKQIKQAFNDLVRPELHKIDLAIANSRRLLSQSLKRELVILVGTVAIGLFSGILPQNIGEIVAALGGIRFTSTLADQAAKLFAEPSEIRDNRFYFLWKIQKDVHRQ